jgi:hypothetical protein
MKNKLFSRHGALVRNLVAVLFCSFLLACEKEKPADLPADPLTDAQAIPLKDVTIQGLPSAWLQYTYNNDRLVTAIRHESGIFQYHLEYRNGRLHQMINTAFAEHDTLLYHYTGEHVSRIDWFVTGNGKRQEIALQYDTANRLTEMTWKKMSTNKLFKKMLFFYNQQHNMIRCDIFYELGSGLVETNRYLFEDFDNKRNVSPNELLKEYHFYFLPQVRLQQNNPLSATLIGVENDFTYDYSYQYNDSLPVRKTTAMKQVRGSEAGVIKTGVTTYSYY